MFQQHDEIIYKFKARKFPRHHYLLHRRTMNFSSLWKRKLKIFERIWLKWPRHSIMLVHTWIVWKKVKTLPFLSPLLRNHSDLEQQTVLKRPSRIPISTRHRSPSPPVVIYKKSHQRSITELRWFCLARKYSLLWQKRAFHCHLRRIKQFSEERLLKRYFILWKKATKTHPYEHIALQFYHQNLLKTYFHQWMHSNSQTQLAVEFLDHRRIKTTWYLWKNQFSKRRLHQRQYQLATEQCHRKILSHVCSSSLRLRFKFFFFDFRSSILSGKRTQMNDSSLWKNVCEQFIISGFLCSAFVWMPG